MFGVDAEDVPRLREERKNFKDYDPRWVKVMDALLSGKFGDKAFFQVRQPRPSRICDACVALSFLFGAAELALLVAGRLRHEDAELQSWLLTSGLWVRRMWWTM